MLTSSALAVYLVELLKNAIRVATQNPSFEFSPKAMAAFLVVANSVATIILAALGQEGYEIPTDWQAWVKNLVLAVLGALVSSALYFVGYVPFRAWSQDFYSRAQAMKQAKSRLKK